MTLTTRIIQFKAGNHWIRTFWSCYNLWMLQKELCILQLLHLTTLHNLAHIFPLFYDEAWLTPFSIIDILGISLTQNHNKKLHSSYLCPNLLPQSFSENQIDKIVFALASMGPFLSSALPHSCNPSSYMLTIGNMRGRGRSWDSMEGWWWGENPWELSQ